MPGGEEVPPSGLDWFRLAALGAAPSDNLADYERGGSYSVTLVWGYERGRFICSVQGGTWLVDHMCWTTGE